MNTSIPYPAAASAGVNPVPVPAAEPSYAAVSWSAVAAGAAAAAALSFILLVLGVGLGLSAVSPWSYSTQPLGKATILWVSLMELASSAVGGYMAGRLRVRWSGVHGDEVYFRDTAHGLLAWAAATLLVAALMAGAVRAALGGAIDAGAAVANAVPGNVTGNVAEAVVETVSPAAPSGGATQAGQAGARQTARAPAAGPGADDSPSAISAYYADVLLRSDTMPLPDVTGAALRAELVRMLDSHPGGLSDEDRQYLARTVAKRTGLQPSDAERRVDDVLARLHQARTKAVARAKAAADAARKAGAYSALWMFVALLLGAFSAALAATFGGRQRDLASPPRS